MRGLEELGIRAVAYVEVLMPSGATPVGPALGTIELVPDRCLGRGKTAFSFFSWGQLKHRECTDLITRRLMLLQVRL